MVSVCPRQVRNVGQNDRVTVTVVDERTIHQQAFNDAELRDSRGTERQANRPSPLHDIRVLHHGLDGAIRNGDTQARTVFSYTRALSAAYASTLPCQSR